MLSTTFCRLSSRRILLPLQLLPTISITKGLCASPTPTPSSPPVLTLYTKDPCPLCDEALEVLEPYLDQVNLKKVDITKPENREWWKKYKYEIPVFHLNGEFLMKHRADIQIFTNAIEKLKVSDN